MNIRHGLMEGQVLQRNSECAGCARISGSCKASGDVEIRVLKSGKVLRGLKWRKTGSAESRKFDALLEGLSPGGPYSVELRIRSGRKTREQASVGDVYVGDVWILAGQSNMEGMGNLVHAPEPDHRVRAFYMRDEWDVAEEPLHMLSEAVDVVHNGYGRGPDRPSRRTLEKQRRNQLKGMSPGHVFALDMLRRTKVPQGLIACAHGGTSMAQWSPSLRSRGGASLYGAMMRRYEKLGQPVAGIIWYQGESEANPDAARAYTERMKELVGSTRRDMGIPLLPWMVVQLGCHAANENDDAWNSVQEQQRRLPQVIDYLDVAPAIDLELDDGIHIGGRGHRVLGRRLARIADSLVHGVPGVKPGIKLKEIQMAPTPGANPQMDCTSVKITYVNVAGKLISDGRPSGFTLVDGKGRDMRGVFKILLKRNSAILCTTQSQDTLSMLSVSYGHGRFPMCNITDSEGMSIPVMQAVPVDPDRMPWLGNWQVVSLGSSFSLRKLSYARLRSVRGWKQAPERNPFGALPKPATSKRTGVYCFRRFVRASEKLEARLVFGANAPFKLWLNGRLLLSDAECTMPINNPRYKADVELKTGKNDLLVAFATDNPGSHIGICARIGSRDEKIDHRIS